MVTDGNYLYCGEHCIMHVIVESPYCIPKTNIIFYVGYTSIKNFLKFKL